MSEIPEITRAEKAHSVLPTCCECDKQLLPEHRGVCKKCHRIVCLHDQGCHRAHMNAHYFEARSAAPRKSKIDVRRTMRKARRALEKLRQNLPPGTTAEDVAAAIEAERQEALRSVPVSDLQAAPAPRTRHGLKGVMRV